MVEWNNKLSIQLVFLLILDPFYQNLIYSILCWQILYLVYSYVIEAQIYTIEDMTAVLNGLWILLAEKKQSVKESSWRTTKGLPEKCCPMPEQEGCGQDVVCENAISM
jgi:hypothetical protein